MNLGIDGRPLCRTLAGIGRYTYEIVKRLDAALPDARFFVYAPRPVAVPLPSERWTLRVEDGPLARHLKPMVWLKTRPPRLFRRDRLDAFWGAGTFLPRLPTDVRSVSTVYDLCHIHAPEMMPSLHGAAHKLFFARDVRRAHVIVSISQGTSDRLDTHFGRRADVIARPGVSDVFLTANGRDQGSAWPAKPGTPFILSVGTVQPRKNLAPLINAYASLRSSGYLADTELVLAGMTGWKEGPVLQLATSTPGVRLAGYVSDDQLAHLYRTCRAFVFPSLYEGFGIPVVEAKACGARIVASDTPEVREAGGEGPVYVEPTAGAIARGIVEVLDRPRPSASDKGLPSWDEAARRTAEAVHLALGDRPPARSRWAALEPVAFRSRGDHG